MSKTRAATTRQDHELEIVAQRIVDRVVSVYRDEYIDKCVREEPDSLLGLVKLMDRILSRRRMAMAENSRNAK